MGKLSEKAAYLQGMMEGMSLDTTTNEGKLIMHIIQALQETAAAIGELTEAQEELSEYVDSIDEDVALLEARLIDDDDDDDEDEDDEEYDLEDLFSEDDEDENPDGDE